MSGGVVRLLGTWIALLLLLAATVAIAHLPIGPAKAWLGYAIASAKAALILWFFMEMRREDAIARFAAIAAFVWLAMMLTLTASDYATRGWIGS
jgi:cytochrome c oxidase subunit 4